MKNRILGLAALLSVAASAHNSDNYVFTGEEATQVIEVKASSRAERQAVADMGYALEDLRSDKVYVYGSEKDAKRIEAQGFTVQSWPLEQRWTEEGFRPGAAAFHSFEQTQKALTDLEQQYSAIAGLAVIGRSLENRPITMLRISSKSPAQAQAMHLPAILYVGCHHAREHLSVEVPLMFAQHLLANYGKDPNITRLVDSREIFIAPMVNPDGHSYDYTGNNSGRMWRKNRRPNNGGTYGVDLNRNYGFMWGTGGSSNDPGSDVYMGPQPFSEPETVVVRDFVRSNPRITTLLTTHTFSELILYPWGHTHNKIGQGLGNAADLPVFQKMAQTMAGWNHYTPEQASDLYIASGDTCDWAYGERGIFCFTFELTPKSMWDGGFYPGIAAIDSTFAANLNPMLYLLEFSDNPHRVLGQRRTPNFLNTPVLSGIPIAHPGDVQL